jgi:hypothetical protein
MSPELNQAVRDRFAQEDTKNHAPQGTPPRKALPAGEFVRKIEKATRLALLLVFLLPAFHSDGAAPDDNKAVSPKLSGSIPSAQTLVACLCVYARGQAAPLLRAEYVKRSNAVLIFSGFPTNRVRRRGVRR